MNNFDAYLNELADNLARQGFRIQRNVRLDPYFLHIVASVNAVEVTKFGKMSRVVPITSMNNPVTIEMIKDFSASAMRYSLDNRGSDLPRGFGGSVLSVPTIVSDEYREDVKKWISKNRPPRHFAAAEFPVLLSTAVHGVYYYKKTPMWGAVYYRGFRKFVQEIFGPSYS